MASTKASIWRVISARISTSGNRPKRAPATTAPILGNAPPRAKPGMDPSGAPHVRLRWTPTSARPAKPASPRAADGHEGMLVMAEVAVSRPAAIASRIPRLTPGAIA